MAFVIFQKVSVVSGKYVIVLMWRFVNNIINFGDNIKEKKIMKRTKGEVGEEQKYEHLILFKKTIITTKKGLPQIHFP